MLRIPWLSPGLLRGSAAGLAPSSCLILRSPRLSISLNTGEKAAEKARQLGVRGFVLGNQVFLAEPQDEQDLELMAHEATHFIQLGRGGQESKSPAGGAASERGQPREALEKEAEVGAGQVAQGGEFHVQGKAGGTESLKDDKTASAGAAPGGSTRTVPAWKNLPGHAQTALTKVGFGQASYEKRSDVEKLTMLNLSVKLAGIKFWGYVARIVKVGEGYIDFQCSNVQVFKNALRASSDNTSPEGAVDVWSAREIRYACSLHFKHNKDWGHAPDVLQAHVDQYGPFAKNLLARIFGFPYTLGRHLATMERYKDVFGIRKMLLEQGWDRASLVGKS